MATTRPLNTATLDAAARDWAGQWLQPTRYSRTDPKLPIMGRGWVLENFYRADFKDEFEYLLPRFRKWLGPAALTEFDAEASKRFTPRKDEVLEKLLAEKLAIKPDGTLIKGKLGSVVIGQRIVGKRAKTILSPRGREITVLVPIREPVYAGDTDFMGSVNATVMNISAEAALLGLDAIVDNLDSEAGAAVIKGYTGSQPADPDAATTGTLLFTLVMSDPAFGAAADQADGTVQAAASAISDDTSADATGTLGYCRVSASADGAAETDPQIDGEAGTSGADFNFNTVSIVSGATVSMTSYTITLDQGSTAT